MRLKHISPWLVLLALVLAFSTAACGASPTPDEPAASPSPSATSAKPGAGEPSPSAVPSDTPLPVDVTTEPPPASPTPTPTPTPGGAVLPTPTSPPSPCEGQSGEIEVQVLVGPAEVVGLEPIAVGTVPFSVVSDQAPYLVEGAGSISYQALLEEKWGTYEVTMDLVNTISGECAESGTSGALHLVLEMTGEQMVEVKAEGFQGQYPWSGTQSFPLDFPLTDGVAVEGEGFSFVLRLPGP